MRKVRKTLLARSAVLVSMALVMGATAVTAVSASTTVKKKHLSQTDINIIGSPGADLGLVWIAQKRGYFHQQGLNVSMALPVGGSSAANAAAFVGGNFQFLDGDAANAMTLAQQGAAIEAVAAMNLGQTRQIAMSTAIAAKFGIPAESNTPAQVVAQLKKLKGTHVQISVTGLSGNAYNGLVADLAVLGLSYGLNNTQADVDIVTTGSSTQQIAGLAAGTLQAFANTPPNTTQPNSIVINFGNAPPASHTVGIYLVAKKDFVQQHPDSVQAFDNAIALAWQYAKQHPAGAVRSLTSLEVYNGITSPDEQTALIHNLTSAWYTPLMPQATFQDTINLYNAAQPNAPLTLTYSQWVNAKFINNAVKNLHINAPKTIKK